jgi:2,6-dihydroxypyridine 3-monooxygenase
LSAALWLREAGWDVDVLERSPSPLEGRGAGIVLHPATIRYLVEHGTADLEAISAPARWLRYLGADAAVLSQAPCAYRFTSWTTLYRQLLAHFGRGRYRMGTEVAGVESDPGGASAVTASGERFDADLLVGADGVASTVRSALLPDVQPAYAGYVGWRGTVAEDGLSGETFAALHEAITYHLRPRSHILAYPIPDVAGTVRPGRRLLNWVWYRNVASGAQLDDLMTGTDGLRHWLSLPPGRVRAAHLDQLRSAAERLPAPLAEAVTQTAEPFVQLIVDVAVPRMVFGRVCLLGDAAFALRPHAAVGTAKAAEDAYQLARSLRSVRSGDVDRALAGWEAAQLRLGRQAAGRTCAAGNRSQFEGTWQVGEPLPFGLYEVGDSAIHG